MAAEPGPGPDPELEELLDSALDDFEKARPAAPPPPPPPPPPGAQPSPSAAAKASLFASQERFFQELFEGELASQAAAEFEQAMQELAREEPHLVEQFQKLSEAAGRVGSDTASQQEFTSCLKETLSGLARNATDLQSSSASEEELTKALEGLGLEEGDGEGSVLPVMRSIMQSLLSKDVLYPSLKEITEKYPEWLRQHGEELPAEQYERYQAQHGVMGRICQQLEGERPGEGEEERRARFETLLDLMQQVSGRGTDPHPVPGATLTPLCLPPSYRTWGTRPRSWLGSRPPASTWTCQARRAASSAASCSAGSGMGVPAAPQSCAAKEGPRLVTD